MMIMKVLFVLLLFLRCATCIAEIQQINEPESNYSDGSINITTGCVFNITGSLRNVKWYTVEGNLIREYEPNKKESIDKEEPCSPESRNGEFVKRLTLGFHLNEAMGDTKEVKFRVTFDHDSNTTKTLSLTTKNFYKIGRVVSMSCTPDLPKFNSPFTCTCKNAKGKGIEWYKGNWPITACVASKDRCSPRPGVDYEVNSWSKGLVSYYNLTVKRCNYSDCVEFRCQDFSIPPNEAKQRVSITAFDVTECTRIAEPEFNYTDGIINITTGCILNMKLKAMWYTVDNGVQNVYRPHTGDIINTYDISACEACNDVSGRRWTFELHHNEATVNLKEVKFRIVIFHNNLVEILNLTTKNFYRIETNDKCCLNGREPIACMALCLIAMAICISILIICIVVKWKTEIYSFYKRLKNLTMFQDMDESTIEDNRYATEDERPMISGTDETIQFKRLENSDSGKKEKGAADVDNDSDDFIDVDNNGGGIWIQANYNESNC